MNGSCGFDFGTSNSTIGVADEKGRAKLVVLEDSKPSIRSAIFCDNELKQWEFGQQGINSYLNGATGRLMMALKSVLGSSLMADKTVVFNQLMPFTEILATFMSHIKKCAEKAAGHELTQVVLGRPVRFHDTDDTKDLLAQHTLEHIACAIGFKQIVFQYEPIAAAVVYEASISSEQLALIIDMGGGTSDFTIIKLTPNNQSQDRTQDVLSNYGIHIAGTDFDKRLSLDTVMPLLGKGSLMSGSSSDIEVPSVFYHELTTWHTLNNLYGAKTISRLTPIYSAAYDKKLIERLIKVLERRSGHYILNRVEISKQKLSDLLTTHLNLDFIEENLNVNIHREQFNEMIDDYVTLIVNKIREAISTAAIDPQQINAIFYTGGSTKIPIIREEINKLLPSAQVIHGDAFGSVGLGLTIDALRKFR